MTKNNNSKENYFIYHNYIWWLTEGSKEKNSLISSGYDRDDIIKENKYGKSIIEINRKIITIDSQIGKITKNLKQRSYINGFTTLEIAKKIWKILKDSKSVGYMYCDGNVLKKNKVIKNCRIGDDDEIPLTKVSGPLYKKLFLKTIVESNGKVNVLKKIFKNKEEKGLFKKNIIKVTTSQQVINNGCKSYYNDFSNLINKKKLRPKEQKELIFVSFIGYRFGKERNPLVNKIAKIISKF